MDPRTAKPALANRIQQTPLVYFPRPPPSLHLSICLSILSMAVSLQPLLTSSSIAAPRAPKSIRGRGRARGARGGAGRSAHRPKKTVEELDAEMSDYYSAANPAA